MSWSPAIYCQFPTREGAVEFGATLGIEFPDDGTWPTGNRNFALVEIPAPWITEPVSDD